ncbi:MAG TPA: hypothetical protein VEY49_08375 [Solirubrobacteraceae bacterium]|nr:hypothetical protein [Solirubrobacteraceae bacterium]
MIRSATLPPVLAAALLAACGGGERGQAAAAAATPEARTTEVRTTARASAPSTAAAASAGRTIKAVRSQFGKILADGRGQAVYLFAKETSSTPRCYGACAKAWPPVLTRGRPVAGRGAGGVKLGTTRRRNGARQVTLGGRPLYYYVDDAPGRVLCHNVDEFGGLWLVVRPNGTPVA